MNKGLVVIALLAFTAWGIYADLSLWFTVPAFIIAIIQAIDA